MATDPFWVTLAIESGVMFRCRIGPVAEPIGDWLQIHRRIAGMSLENLPLFVGGATVLVQNLMGNVELANIVKKRAPAKLVELITADSKLFTEKLGVGPYSFGVAAGQSVMIVHVLEQLDQVVRT